jgi:TnpA family transposase
MSGVPRAKHALARAALLTDSHRAHARGFGFAAASKTKQRATAGDMSGVPRAKHALARAALLTDSHRAHARGFGFAAASKTKQRATTVA